MKGSLNFSGRESVREIVSQVNQSLVCGVNRSPCGRECVVEGTGWWRGPKSPSLSLEMAGPLSKFCLSTKGSVGL